MCSVHIAQAPIDMEIYTIFVDIVFHQSFSAMKQVLIKCDSFARGLELHHRYMYEL